VIPFINKQYIITILTLSALFIAVIFLGKIKFGSNQFITDEMQLEYEVFPLWEARGISAYHGIPVALAVDESTQEASAGSISVPPTRPMLTHPPFAYYLGYLLYILFHGKWYLINYVLSFISAILIYATVCLLCYHRFRNKLHLPALFAFLIYITNPFVMKTQMHIYHPDTVVQAEIIGLTYIALKMIMRKQVSAIKYLLFFSILNFIMVYTSWIGVLFSLTITCYGIVNLRKGYSFSHIVLLSLLSSLLALSLFTMQYGREIGLENYLRLLANTYLQESEIKYIFAFNLNGAFIASIYKLLRYYFEAYWPIYLSIFIFVLFALTGKGKKIIFTKNGYRYLVLAILPVMMSHLLLMSYSLTLPYSLLYALSFLSVMMGILFEKIYKSALFDKYIFFILSSIPILAQLISGK
jgi:hypothetical protein